ncbi:SART-1 family protein [Nymphaea thermarum]|nr:SART-1 family protein [Nymphaea thermarum]
MNPFGYFLQLRKRLESVSAGNHFEDLTTTTKVSSDYYTREEMLQFRKPKKKKSLRKKEKLDLDAMEAEAKSAGLGIGDLGSRKDMQRQLAKEAREKAEAEERINSYKSAYSKAEEASRVLREEQTLTIAVDEDENPVFGDEDEDLYKSLDKARKFALKKQEEEATSGPQAVALRAISSINQSGEAESPAAGETQDNNKIVFTEMEEFVWGLQLDEDSHKPDKEDVFKDDEEAKESYEPEKNDTEGGWMEIKAMAVDEASEEEKKEEIVPDETIHEVPVGKGLAGALQLLKERGTLKETVDWGGRTMDKKKSKLMGIRDNDGSKEISLDRLDEFGRIMTPKEAFRKISHKFHGKGPGKMKQEKRMKQYEEELKLKQMKASDTPLLSMEKMRETQAKLNAPYIVLSGQIKPGQTSDPRSGFATVEKDHPGNLTPMLGDRKVEHFLGIKRKAEPSNLAPTKKPKA